MKTLKNIIKLVKKSNRITLIASFWLAWLLLAVMPFAGTYAVYIVFFIGMAISLVCASWVLENQNEREKRFLEKIGTALFD